MTNGSIVASIDTGDLIEAQIGYSTDNAQNFISVPLEEIVHSLSFSMDYFFYENSADVYLATNDLGVIKLNIDLSNLGTPDYLSSKGITVYPNPTKDVVYIEADNNSITEVAIYSSLGAMLGQYPTSESISLSGLSPGVYFLKVSTEKGIYIKRVLKE